MAERKAKAEWTGSLKDGSGTMSLGSGTFGLVGGRPFMRAYWVMLEIPLLEELVVGTPLLFDCGVYLVVLGVTLTIIFSLAEES